MRNEKTLIGVGLRPNHYPEVETSTKMDWFEVISENYMNTEGRPIQMLEKIRKNHPIALHGVGLTIGSYDGVSKDYLKRLRSLRDRIQPLVVSDHLCWSSLQGHSTHDLLPLPLSRESLDTISVNILQVQDFLGQSICLENISYYLKSKFDEISEPEFLNEICRRTGCGLLLDLNNVDVNSMNHQFNSEDFLSNLDLNHVRQIHLAGPSNENGFVFDTHSTPVPDSVWSLYKIIVQKTSSVPVIIEWDENTPSLGSLEIEVEKARQICNQNGLVNEFKK